MTHLGRWLSALVDGELDPAERDHVLNHLAGCEACLREANELRALKRRMTALGGTCEESESGSAVVRRLIDLGRFDSLGAGGTSFAELGPVPEFLGPARQSAAWRARSAKLGWKLATGSAGATFLAIGLAAFMLGAPAGSPRPQVTPALDVYWSEHVHDMGQAPTKSGTPGHVSSVGFAPGGTAPSKPSAARSSATKPTTTRDPRRQQAAARGHVVRRRAARRRATASGQFAFHGLP